jgi:hypothetical protein
MTMIRTFAAVFVALVLAWTPVQAGSPAISTAFKDVAMDLATCQARMTRLMQSNGFTRVEALQRSVFGDYGDYQLVIRCVPDKAIVFLAVAGPQAPECDRLLNLLLGQI